MRTRIHAARLRIRPIWLMAAATCLIPTLLISDASLKSADARMMMERPTMGHAPRMGGGGHRMHGHRGGGYRGFSGGSALGLGLAVGGMVIDQMQRAQARDRDYDEPRDAPARGRASPPRQHIGTATSPKVQKKRPPASAQNNKNDKPVYAKNKDDKLYAKKQDTPYSGKNKDEPRFGRGDPRDVPVARRGDPRDVPVGRGRHPRDVPVYRDPRDVPVPTGTTTREPGLKAPPEYPTGRPPRPPEYRPPSTPLLVSNPVPIFPAPPPAWHCRDCKELEQWIERLKNQIEKDEQKLADAEKTLKEREQERDDLKDKVRNAKGRILKAYYQDRLDSVEEYIDRLDTYNDELRRIIEEEKELKAKLEEEYNKCADPQCREQITQVPQTPKEPGPTPEQPKDTPVTSAPPSEDRPNPTPVALVPGQPEPPQPASTPANACPDHWAELTNGKRKFHRLYVLGMTNSQEERELFLTIQDNLKAGLEGPGRQAPQSTSKEMNEPTLAEFRSEMQRLADVVQPCEEVTLNLLAHGGGGITNGRDLPALTPGGETKAELILLKDKKTGVSEYQYLFDRELGEMIKKFKPNVSVTVLMYSCWGGGFAGKGNVEESKLVKVIGTYSQCRPFGFNNEIRKGIDDLAGKSKDGRVTAIEIKDHLRQKGWPLGEPFDNWLDRYVNERLDEYLPR